jgi:hypothetical protein
MKAIATIVALILACALAAQAQTYNVTQGFFTEWTASDGSTDAFAYQFAGIANDTAFLFIGGNDDKTGFSQCAMNNGSGCSLTMVKQIGKTSPLYIYPNGYITDGTNSYCTTGGGPFTYTSGFSYGIKNGVLTAKGNVIPTMGFTPGDLLDCNPVGLGTFNITGEWNYIAQLTIGSTGAYYLNWLQITPGSLKR